MAGLSSAGFEIKDLDTILAEIEAAEQGSFGTSVNLRASSVLGVLNGVVTQKLSEIWQLLQAVYDSQYPDGAEGTALDQLAQLTGVRRLEATQSVATCTITGTPATIIPSGSRIQNSVTNTFWSSTASATISAASTVSALFYADDYGPVIGAASTLTVIDTPVAGWTSVNNPADATIGRDEETDAELRVRRADLLTSQGKGTVDAIRADVLAVTDVLECLVFENYTNATDADGLPSHSFEVVVRAGDDTEIAQAIWDSKPAGISAYGTSTGTATDEQGSSRVVAFTRPTVKNVYISCTAVTSTGWGGATAAIAQALVDFSEDEYQIGDDVYFNELYGPIYDVAGVLNVTSLKTGFSASPVGTSDLTIGQREIADFDTSRIVVTLA